MHIILIQTGLNNRDAVEPGPAHYQRDLLSRRIKQIPGRLLNENPVRVSANGITTKSSPKGKDCKASKSNNR